MIYSSHTCSQVLPLYKSGRTKPIGTLCVKVRLTSHGDLLVTQFEQIADGYQYKDKTEYSPTNAKGSKSCLLKKKHSKKCCAKNKARMIERDIKSKCCKFKILRLANNS